MHCLGTNHDHVPVDKLAAILTDLINDLMSKVTEKEKDLERLFKLTSKLISGYDVETVKLVKRIDDTQNKEVRNTQTR